MGVLILRKGRDVMGDHHLLLKVLGAIGAFTLLQLFIFWQRVGDLSDGKMTLEAEVQSLSRKRDHLLMKIGELERDEHRLQLRVERMDQKVRDLLPLTKKRPNLPTVFFVTPTRRRPAQKADLIRLFQTLAHVNNLFWVVVEDGEQPSAFIDEIFARSKLTSVHITAVTPKDKRMNDTDPNWKVPRGVAQRNAALQWIRTNFGTWQRGVVYFGDDDNVYDWKLFDEMRTIERVGVWPVGIVGGLLAEAPLLHLDGSISGFNSVWAPERPFPFDMAAFAVNITLILAHPDARFTYDSPRGYQESHFLGALKLRPYDLEPKADRCTKVYVWHTRTERVKLTPEQRQKMVGGGEGGGRDLTEVERDAIE